jgi:hypothetical protein
LTIHHFFDFLGYLEDTPLGFLTALVMTDQGGHKRRREKEEEREDSEEEEERNKRGKLLQDDEENGDDRQKKRKGKEPAEEDKDEEGSTDGDEETDLHPRLMDLLSLLFSTELLKKIAGHANVDLSHVEKKGGKAVKLLHPLSFSSSYLSYPLLPCSV